MNKGLSIVQKKKFNANHFNSFGSVLTAVNEVRKRIVFILGNIIVFFCRLVIQCTVACGSLMQPSNDGGDALFLT